MFDRFAGSPSENPCANCFNGALVCVKLHLRAEIFSNENLVINCFFLFPRKLSLDANETENQAQHTSVEIEDDDDAISEQFQATVLKRGSVKIDKRRPVSDKFTFIIILTLR